MLYASTPAQTQITQHPTCSLTTSVLLPCTKTGTPHRRTAAPPEPHSTYLRLCRNSNSNSNANTPQAHDFAKINDNATIALQLIKIRCSIRCEKQDLIRSLTYLPSHSNQNHSLSPFAPKWSRTLCSGLSPTDKRIDLPFFAHFSKRPPLPREMYLEDKELCT